MNGKNVVIFVIYILSHYIDFLYFSGQYHIYNNFKSIQTLFRKSKIQLDFFWKPLHLQKPYKNFTREKLKFTELIWKRVIILPSHPGVTKNEIKFLKGLPIIMEKELMQLLFSQI